MSRNPIYDTLLNLGNSPDENTLELARRWQAVFAPSDGQLCLEDLKRKFYFYDSTLHENYTQANEGNRQVVLYILAMLNIDTSPQQQKPIDYSGPEPD